MGLADRPLVEGLHQRVGDRGEVHVVDITIGGKRARRWPLAALLRPAGLAGGAAVGPRLANGTLTPVGALRRRAAAAVVVMAPVGALAVPRALAVTRALAIARASGLGPWRPWRGHRLVAANTGEAAHLAHLSLVEVDEQATAQAAWQHHAAVADADQPADPQAYLVEQLAHLAVAAFGDDHPVPAVDTLAAAVLDRLEHGALAVDVHAFEQARLGIGLQRAEHAHRVLTLDAEARVHQLVGQFTRVGEQQQAFGVDVEPTDRLPLAVGQPRQPAVDRRAVLRVVVGDDLADRLVVGDDARRRWRDAHLDQLAGDADAVAK